MEKEAVLARVESLGLLAVLRGPTPALTVQMVDALVKGGVTGIEITYTTPDAPDVVATLARTYGDGILLGMGTLTKPEQAVEAQQAGAQFLVSPHTEGRLAQAMTATGLAVMCGALTPSEVMAAHTLGADVIKVFPGSAVGPSYLKALHGPFPDLRLMPTGGVSLENIGDWFAAGAMAVGAGGALCSSALARDGRFDEITALAKQHMAAVAAARGV